MNDAPPVADSSSITVILDDPQASSWRAALSLLTEREGAVLTLRHGAFGGERLTFAEVAQRLGMSRQRAHQLHERAIEVLRQREETQELVEKLAAMGTPMAMEVESVHADAETGADHRETPQHDSLSPAAGAGQNGITNAAQPDPAPSKRDRAMALKRVSQADRDLAEAVEPCRAHGHEALVAALESARTVIRIHMREMASTPERPAAPSRAPRSAARPLTIPLGRRGPGRPENVVETARRAAVLTRVQSGEISNSEAAAELGIKITAWAGWNAYHQKRNGVIVYARSERAAGMSTPVSAPIPTANRGRGRPSDPVETARRAAVLKRVQSGELTNAQAAAEIGITASAWTGWKAYQLKRASKPQSRSNTAAPASTPTTPDVGELIARLDRVERFGAELRKRITKLLLFIEARVPG